MAVILTNAILVDIDPPRVERGDLRIEGGKIAARGKVRVDPTDERIDCGGAVVLPGLVNGHTHLYSALAVGMQPPPRNPKNFLEILQLVWWRLDRALDEESNEISAKIGALDALACGTTTLIDHHASPDAIDGSLDAIERGLASVGIRGVLCYETTDRNGDAGRDAGLAENARYLTGCTARKNGQFAGLVGAHASFTLGDKSLDALAQMAEKFDTGVHIHVAEDPCDGTKLVDRFEQHRLLKPTSIFAHGIHLDDREIERVNAAKVTMAHNPRSNMNNAVGYSPIGKYKASAMLGTDGIGADMFAESKAAWFKSRDNAAIGGAGISPADVMQMLAASARRASQSLGVMLGKLEVGAVADVVITDYVPFTPLTTQNLPGHFIFAMSSRNVCHVMTNGVWRMRDRKIHSVDAHQIRRDAVSISNKLWDRMSRMDAS